MHSSKSECPSLSCRSRRAPCFLLVKYGQQSLAKSQAVTTHNCNHIKGEINSFILGLRWRSTLGNADIPRAASLHLCVCITSSKSHLKAGCPFSRSKSLGRIPSVHELEREGAGLRAGTPSQWRQLSLLAQVLRDETMSSGDFLQIRQPWPYQNTQLCFHRTSLILSLSLFSFQASSGQILRVPNILSFLDQQRDIHFAQHSFHISIVFYFPLPLPKSPENNFFLVLVTWTTVKVDVFLHFAGYFLQKRQNRGWQGCRAWEQR